MDIENPGHDHSEEDIDVFYDGKKFPFPDNQFDSVLTNQVLEHVFNPTEFLSEINRVLKPKGYLLLTVPFVWDEHEQPFDYGRYSSFGIKHILEKNHFVIVEYSKSCKGIKAVFQLMSLNIYKKFFSKNRLINVALTFLLISPFTILGIILSRFGQSNSDLFLDNVVLARKVG
jgi:SAM-dependent methyltransferase